MIVFREVCLVFTKFSVQTNIKQTELSSKSNQISSYALQILSKVYVARMVTNAMAETIAGSIELNGAQRMNGMGCAGLERPWRLTHENYNWKGYCADRNFYSVWSMENQHDDSR